MLSKMAKDMWSLKQNLLNSVSDSNMCEGKLIIKFFLNKYQNYHVSGYENPILHNYNVAHETMKRKLFLGCYFSYYVRLDLLNKSVWAKYRSRY